MSLNHRLKYTKMKASIFVFLIICKTVSNALDCPILFQGIKGHSACLPTSPDYVSGGVSKEDINLILNEHNKYRASVDPPACKMLKMYWNDNLAYVAQKWAQNCKFAHDHSFTRYLPGTFMVGQNIGNGFDKWSGCIAAWYSEKKDFIYNGTVDSTKVGHYTQLVWETTSAIGCGYAKCKNFPLYVCNYGPSGNYAGNINRPYEKCKEKQPLKDCNGKFCKNDGTIKSNSCECNCKPYKHIYGPDCSTNCTVKDEGPCVKVFVEKSCSFGNVPAMCPWLCKTCPYLDQKKSGTAVFKHSMMPTLSLMVLILMVMT